MKIIFAAVLISITALTFIYSKEVPAEDNIDLYVSNFKGKTIVGNELRQSWVEVVMVFENEVRQSKYINFEGTYNEISMTGSCEERLNFRSHTRNRHRSLYCTTYLPLRGESEIFRINIILDDLSNAGTLMAVAGFPWMDWDQINFENFP